MGWGEVVVLIAAGLIILGPERLPGAIASMMSWIRKARDYATGATADLRKEMGSDFDDLREPLNQLNELRSMNPRNLVAKHLLGGDDSLLDPKTYTELPEPKTTEPSPTPQPPAPERRELPAMAPKSGQRHSVTDWDAT
nr:Sec-independent protein translocase protein TatB [Gordonia araii]